MADATATRQADSYGIGLPVEWDELPLDPEGFERSVQTTLHRLEDAGIARPDRRRLELLQRQIRDLLVAGQCQYAATLAAVTGGEESDDATTTSPADDGERDVVLASLAILSRSRADLDAPTSITAPILLRGLAADDDGGSVDVRPPEQVELPAGTAVRLVRYHTYEPSPGQQMEFYSHSYLVPHDEGQRLCTLQIVTPTIEYAEPLGELFDAIAETLRIFYPDDPTTFDDARAESDAAPSEDTE